VSGIAGILRLDGRGVTPMELSALAAGMERRGPDAARDWRCGSVGLVHCLLRTGRAHRRDELPLADIDAPMTITADVRLDNRGELMDALGLAGSAPRQTSDAGLILAAYRRWGEGCPERLLGDFAFVIHDGRRRVLFGARDPFGTRPFYYHRSDAAFVFASEVDALRRVPGLRFSVHEARIADYLVPALERRYAGASAVQDPSRPGPDCAR